MKNYVSKILISLLALTIFSCQNEAIDSTDRNEDVTSRNVTSATLTELLNNNGIKTSEGEVFYKLNEEEVELLNLENTELLASSIKRSKEIEETNVITITPEPLTPTPVQPRAIICYRLNGSSPWDCFVVHSLNDCDKLTKCSEDMNCRCKVIN